MSPPARDRQAGLTLVEVLVALALFALIGLAGFSMLDNILRVRSGTEGRLERLAEIDQALTLFSRDVQQANSASFGLAEGRLSMSRVDVGGISYLAANGALVRRISQAELDQRMVQNVRNIGFRALDTTRTWHDSWPQEQRRALGVAPSLLAVEMRLDLPEGGIIRLVDVPFEPPQ